ncbi:MAG: FAD-dependent oxidoreductase [Thaumarchaeota archaeon]|nr:FAD-dependent oxidoreductase [Nitrososphaerota archaeon]
MSANFKPKRVGPFPFPKSDPDDRKKNFSEVEKDYTKQEVMIEADRCLRCGNPVCMDACPVQMDVRGMCDAVAKGDFKAAFHRIRETNALLGVTSRCCPQLDGLCEDACVMRWGGQPISIGMIQKFVADWERNESRQPDPMAEKETGKLVSVVGAGPAGLAAASLLRRYGHTVTLYDELPTPGGTAWYGIPDYHLPKDVLLYEIERIKGQGVEVRTGVKVGRDVTLTQLLSDGSDAILITTGPKDVSKLDIPGIHLKGVYAGYTFLEDVYINGVKKYLKHPKYDLGKDILVIGGGDSALDAARTALRLTGGNVTVAYRRTEGEMGADPVMVDETREEGIKFKFLTNPKSCNGSKGKLVSITMSAMKLGAPDATGRKSPESIPGQDFDIKCDSALFAVGRGPNSFLQKRSGLKMGKKDAIVVDDHYRSSMAGVFAAGDVTTGETLVVKAMGHGREAAQRVHEYLMKLEDKHVSLYERYYSQKLSEKSYQDMLFDREEKLPPP